MRSYPACCCGVLAVVVLLVPAISSAKTTGIEFAQADDAQRNVGRVGGINSNANRRTDQDIDSNNSVSFTRNITVSRPYGFGGYRRWEKRPYFGIVVAGVTLGSVVAATAVPPSPASNLCWYWADQGGTRGYWDYCGPQ